MESNLMEIMPDAKEEVSTEVVASSRKFVNRYFIFLLIIVGCLVAAYFLLSVKELNLLKQLLSRDHYLFFWMVLAGFAAELVAGSMGMGYGVICTTILLILNVSPPVISASIHSAESFTSATGTISHYKLGNVNMKLFKRLAIPAIIGAIIGALALTYVGEKYARLTKPFLALYSMYLGVRILMNAFNKKPANGNGAVANGRKKTNIPALGLIGGFIDSFGGGGWGPLVTGTFIKNGRTPRFVIGSSTAAKCVLTIASAITFIFTIGIQHWNIVAGLLLGGIVTAPFSAMLTSKLPVRKMFIAVGVVVICCSLITLYRSIFL